MLSIIQFLNALADRVQVDLLSLDSREDIKNYLEKNLGVQLHANLNVVQVTNKMFKVKSNKIFFIGNVIKYLEKITFYGKTHLKRGQGITLVPQKKTEPYSVEKLPIHEFIMEMFRRRYS